MYNMNAILYIRTYTYIDDASFFGGSSFWTVSSPKSNLSISFWEQKELVTCTHVIIFNIDATKKNLSPQVTSKKIPAL